MKSGVEGEVLAEIFSVPASLLGGAVVLQYDVGSGLLVPIGFLVGEGQFHATAPDGLSDAAAGKGGHGVDCLKASGGLVDLLEGEKGKDCIHGCRRRRNRESYLRE